MVPCKWSFSSKWYVPSIISHLSTFDMQSGQKKERKEHVSLVCAVSAHKAHKKLFQLHFYMYTSEALLILFYYSEHQIFMHHFGLKL